MSEKTSWNDGILQNELSHTSKLRTDIAIQAARTRDQQRHIKKSAWSLLTSYNIDDGADDDDTTNRGKLVTPFSIFQQPPQQQQQQQPSTVRTALFPKSKPYLPLIQPPNIVNTSNPPASTNRRVALMFLSQNERTSQYFWNRMAQWWTGTATIHVELLFEHDNTSCIVTSSTPVSFRKNKSYHYDPETARIWQSVQLSLDTITYERVYQFCRQQEQQPFDAIGIHCFPVFHYQSVLCDSVCLPNRLASPNSSRGWICSRLIAAAFKHGNIFSNNVNEYAVTPGELLALLTEDMPPTFRTRYKLTYSPCIGRDALRKLYELEL